MRGHADEFVTQSEQRPRRDKQVFSCISRHAGPPIRLDSKSVTLVSAESVARLVATREPQIQVT